jgi:hypothetical protein
MAPDPFNRMKKQPQDGIWIIDDNGQTVFANQRMAEILGTSPLEMIGHPSFAYVFPEDVEAAQRLFDGKKRGDIDRFTSSCAERMAPPSVNCTCCASGAEPLISPRSSNQTVFHGAVSGARNLVGAAALRSSGAVPDVQDSRVLTSTFATCGITCPVHT